MKAARIQIFISYSHYDRRFIAVDSAGRVPELLRILMPLQEDGVALVWDDHLLAGDYIDQRIRRWLRTCHVLLALVSEDFLHSKYCTDIEVRTLLRRARQDRDVRIVPFYLSPCEWQRVPWLRKLKGLPSPSRTLTDTRGTARRRALLDLRRHLRKTVQLLRSRADAK